MAVLLLADHNNKALGSAVPKALTAALAMGSAVHVLVAGNDCAAVAESASKLTGVAKVILVEAPQLANHLAEEMTALLVPMMANYDGLVAASTAFAKNILPRVAAKLDVMQISDVIAVKSADTFERPIYAGNAIQTVQSSESKKIMTVRTELATDRKSISVTVQDHGDGIDKGAAKKVFEPYFSTKSNGMGIGLTICRSIIESHDGELTYSRAGKRGSVFRFTLPTAVNS